MASSDRIITPRPIRFVLAEVSHGAWAVGYSHRLIPGAVLRTQAAAVRYVRALGEAAGFSDVDIVIASDVDGPAGGGRSVA